MTTEFRFEHVFRAASAGAVLEAYFDPDHLATQDALAELGGRTVVESYDRPGERSCTWRVGALKPLPMFARPFVAGGRLQYLETMTWRRAADEVDLVIKPDLLGGRVQIAAVYALAQIGERQVRRRYAGTVSVDIRLLAGKIERAVVAEMEKMMPVMTKCTQDWLDRTPPA